MLNFATLFSGGELFGVGARQAGLSHAWGVEICPKIAAVARANGFDVHCADVCQFDPPTNDLFLLHASPPCQRASNAYAASSEALLDIRLATVTMNIVAALMPQFFTLENVMAYQRFEAFKNICKSLRHLGYSFGYWNMNMADFGVPQIRRRLILIARRDGRRVQRMNATHKQYPDFFAKKWISWGEALGQEIKRLEILLISKKQKRKMIGHSKYESGRDVLVDTRNGGNRKFTFRLAHEPSYTIMATARKGHGKVRHEGQWYKLNQKAYAILQTVPDDYQFVGTKSINQRIIGNGVPPLFVRRLCEYLIRVR